MLDALKKSFLLLCFSLLVCIWQREEEDESHQYEVSDSYDVEQLVVRNESACGLAYCDSEEERQQELGTGDSKLDAHCSNARSLVDDLSNSRIDTCVEERVCDTAYDSAYISDLVACAAACVECHCESDQINGISESADSCRDPASQLVRKRTCERESDKSSETESRGDSCDSHSLNVPASGKSFLDNSLSENGAADTVQEVVQIKNYYTW